MAMKEFACDFERRIQRYEGLLECITVVGLSKAESGEIA